MMVKTKDLVIDREKYKLDDLKYHKEIFEKKQIVVGHTFTSDMKHVERWKNRYNGTYTKTATFTIDKEGEIYEHFDPKYYSDFLNIKNVDELAISIMLVNEGWLIKDGELDRYFTYLNQPITLTPINKKWRGHLYWAPYTDKQFSSLIELCGYLSKEFGINMSALEYNIKDNNISEFNGIVYRSNYLRDYTDLSPSFDFIKFKNKIEKKEKKNGKS